MIEATCAACGTVNRIAEADVPPGAKFVTCASCKSKVAVTAKPPPMPMAGKPSVPPKIPAVPKLPTPPKGSPAPKQPDSIELADLAPPERQSPLSGVPSLPKPPSRSALAGAELPVPKINAKAPSPPPNSIDLDDLIPDTISTGTAGLANLPSKPRPPSPLGDTPAAKQASKAGIADLPAPKGSVGITDLPAPKSPAGITDLPAPKSPAGITDLPAPKAQAGISDLPAPKAKAGITDLPAPKGQAGITDLPAPKGPAGITDLPAPKAKAGITDLPAPKAKSALADLPSKAAASVGTLELDDEVDLPMPKPGATDLPAPKGFFDDLPQPSRNPGAVDLPAPKGFFDDLPRPVSHSSSSQELAPKGLFDDLPGPGSAPTMDLAPKGLFDDLPQPSKNPTMDLAPSGGLFDDLPNPTPVAKPAASGNLFDDLAPPGGKGAADMALGAGDIDLGPASSGPGLELDGGPAPALDLDGGPALDLGPASSGPDLAPSGPLGEDSAFQDLDLSAPTAGKAKPVEDDSPIKIKTPGKGSTAKPISINVPSKTPPGDMKLDLADDLPGREAAHGGGGAAVQKITAKKPQAKPEEAAETRAAKRKRSRVMLGALLGVAALGGGGFFFYQRHAAAQARAEEIASQLTTAEKALKDPDPNHWARARAAADEAIKLDSTNTRAIGIAVEATIAGALDTGINKDPRIAQGRAMLQDALGAGRTSAEVERAQAVAAIAAKGQAQRAVDLLKVQIGKNPKDGWLQLYMGWAQLANGDAAEATKAFTQASALAPATTISALYGQGQAKLLSADVAGARTAFETILQTAKDHVCAQIGLIATYSQAQSVQQVAELEAVLQRKDIDTSDPRCRVQALTLIGDVHRGAGRLDMARQRYRDALKLVPLDVPSLDGLAAVELREDKLTLVTDLLEKALTVNPEHPETLLMQAELRVREGKLPEAEGLVDKLAAHQPPLPTMSKAQLFVVRGKLLEAKGQDDAAVDAYVEGAKLAGELDLTPTMAAVTKLGSLAKKEADPAKAAAYRARADELLSKIADRAQEDAQLSTAIGIAYLGAGDPAKAETYLRRAVALKSDDVEAKLQLAKVENVLGKPDDAIAQLKEAQGLDGKRTDVALELAKTYQLSNRHDEAIAAYDKLLALPDVPIIVRVNAGRYYAKRGMIDRAAAQAVPVLAAEPENPGGLYLSAEGLLKAGKPEEASPLLVKATDVDPDAQYLDALGRALEARLAKSEDTKFIESARFAYERASKADPTMFHPWLGQGRMIVARRDWTPALAPLIEANKLDKTNAEAMYFLGVAYFGLRAKPEARKVAAEWLDAALKGQPTLDLEQRANGAWMLGTLNNDLNKGANAAAAWDHALKLGEELEKQTGKTPPWLTETYYELGDLYDKMASYSNEKRMFERYIARNPKPGQRLDSAKQALLTKLKTF